MESDCLTVRLDARGGEIECLRVERGALGLALGCLRGELGCLGVRREGLGVGCVAPGPDKDKSDLGCRARRYNPSAAGPTAAGRGNPTILKADSCCPRTLTRAFFTAGRAEQPSGWLASLGVSFHLRCRARHPHVEMSGGPPTTQGGAMPSIQRGLRPASYPSPPKRRPPSCRSGGAQ